MARTRILLTILSTALGRARSGEVGRLPALGWNTWNAFRTEINETVILSTAENMVSKGFLAAGYEYVNIDDCWSVKEGRDNITRQLLPEPSKFPDGISGLADKIHAMGLKIGIYSTATPKTCAGYPGSLGHEYLDAATFAAWGIDYLKYDNCNIPGSWNDSCVFCNPDSEFKWTLVNGSCVNASEANFCPEGYDYATSNTAERFRRMREALSAQNRTILYSLCDWGEAKVWTWGADIAESWRTTSDIFPWFERVLELLNLNSFLSHYTDFDGHGDPDMLEVGNGNLTTAETRTHFAFWAILKGPILIGTDLSAISQENVDLLLNPYLLAFNQDPVIGRPAAPYKWGVNPDWTWNRTHPAEYWAGESSKGTLVAMFNSLDDNGRVMTADWSEVPGLTQGASFQVVDVWTGKDLGCVHDGYSVTVASHDTAVLLVQDTCK